MAHIERRVIKGHTYYYACRKGRVNGKPTNVWQKCLGTADKVIQIFETYEVIKDGPISAVIAEFGGVAALLTIAERLKLVETINRHIPRKFRSISTGDYMLLASINRCLAPTSKRKLADWYSETSLARILGFQEGQLTSQRFWDHMDLLTVERIRAIEADLTEHLITEFDIDLGCLLYDATNFYTFIDTFTDGDLARRGKNKQGRANLRQIGMALLVTKDFHIPLLHEIYRGNLSDSQEFASISELLVHRYKKLHEECEDITLVFDKGNNSKANFETIEESPFHFVASLVPSHHDDLLAIPLDKFTPATDERLSEISTYRTKKEVFGVERTIVISYNENLLDSQLSTLVNVISKARGKLNALQQKIVRDRTRRKGKRLTVESIDKQVKAILSPQHLSKIINVNVSKDRWGFKLKYRVQRKAIVHLMMTLLGKKILFTDQDDWSDEAIVLAYHGQACIEEAFKRMKDPHFLCWYPQFHWTDQKMQVHGFYCVLALTLASLLRRELALHDIQLSIPKMFDLLKKINEVAHIYPQPSTSSDDDQRPSSEASLTTQDKIVLSKMSSLQLKIFEFLGLHRFAPVKATPYCTE